MSLFGNMKQKILTESESRTTLNAWVESLQFLISNDPRFSRFIDDLKTWKPSSVEYRGFTSDGTAGMTANNKLINLKVLLGWISIHAPVISSSFIKEEACSLDEVYQRLREYYDCNKSGSKITELLDFRLGSLESREAIWERIYSFLEDNLITKDSGILHKGERLTQDEHMTPLILNMAVVIWLDSIHRGLPALVKQRFAIPLRSTTIFSIRAEISDAIPSLLQELGEKEGNISYSSGYSKDRRGKFDKGRSRQKFKPKCCICEAAGRPGADTHYFQNCPFLPAGDRKFLKSKIGDVEVLSESSTDDEDDDDQYNRHKTTSRAVKVKHKGKLKSSSVNSVDIISSPCMEVQVDEEDADITLDTGAESNLIKKSEARRLNLTIHRTTHRANMADGVSPMEVAGEVHFTATRKCPTTRKIHSFQFDGLVVKDLNCGILGGMPYMHQNDIYLRPNVNSVYVGDCCNFRYVSIRRSSTVRAATILKSEAARIIRVPRQVCLLPGSDVTLPVPPEYDNETVSVEPRCLSSKSDWMSCSIQKARQGTISVRNESTSPVLIKRHEQLCQIRHTVSMPEQRGSEVPPPIKKPPEVDRSSEVVVDPSNILTAEEKSRFREINKKYHDVFSPTLGRYNDKSGPFTHKVNMSSSLPPQRRGKVPMYNRTNLELLQAKFDELLAYGVFVRPEDINISAENVSPSFLVAKSDGDWRLVTAFTEIGQYAKVQPSLTATVEDVIRHIGQYKFIVQADLTKAYYQIPLDKSSMKYCGVCTPFRGVYVYTRAVMGMPGSESALEQLLAKVLGDPMVDGAVVKLADDMYVCGNTPDELSNNWEVVLRLMSENNLRLSPTKTVCCPTSAEILGWKWEQGTVRATNHKMNTLAACDPPETIRGLRSFIGSYKFLSKVLPKHSDMLSPLDKLCAKGVSADKVPWTDELLATFQKAKNHLTQAKTLTIPRREDKLQIITDAASTAAGLAASLFVIRNNKPHLAGLFNARKTSSQAGWLACELEALSIAAAVKHFSPYIVQSRYRTEVLTDSRPCVQAYQKLMRGGFSNSSRVTSFLATISRFQVTLGHIAGKNNDVADYGSRHALECEGNCQICKFISDLETSVVRGISVSVTVDDILERRYPVPFMTPCQISRFVVQEITVQDVLEGRCPVPYMTRTSWLQAQQDCSDLKQVYRLLKDGMIPSRKKKGMTDVRRYLQHCKLSTTPKDGLIVVTQEEALRPTRQRIVVPRHVVSGLLTALHIQLKHPSKLQLKKVFNIGFYALDSESEINHVVDGCYTCASLKNVPAQFKEQSTSVPDKIGASYAGDVVKREGQLVFLLRENISAYTEGTFLQSESSDSLRDGLIKTISKFRPPSGVKVGVRVDGAPGCQRLSKDPSMVSLNIELEIGEAKNINRNPIADKSCSEFQAELCRLKPQGGKITETELSMILSHMNSRIRQSGYSASEIWTQRDMVTGDKLPIDDSVLIAEKHQNRLKQHNSSAKYKGRGRTKESEVDVKIGEIVYLYGDRVKTQSRLKYMVTKIEGKTCTVQKFTANQLRCKKYKVRLCELIKVEGQSVSKPVIEEAEEDIDLKPEISECKENTSDKSSDESSSEDPPNESSSEGSQSQDEESSSEDVKSSDEDGSSDVHSQNENSSSHDDQARVEDSQPEGTPVDPPVEVERFPKRDRRKPKHFDAYEMSSP